MKNYLRHIRVIILVPFLVTIVQAIRSVVTSTRCPMMTNYTYQIIPAFLFVEKNIKKIFNMAKVSLLGVVAPWDDCKDIPKDQES